jgi:hypothetical protein
LDFLESLDEILALGIGNVQQVPRIDESTLPGGRSPDSFADRNELRHAYVSRCLSALIGPLCDEHRDAVEDGVHVRAVIASKLVLFGAQSAMAGGTGELIQD